MSRLTTVVPVFNGERYLLETLQSVASQTRRPDRLVVLDNCSTDGTCEIVKGFRALPCEWRQNERNVGLLANLNRALGFAADTEYLHLLMADELPQPAFFEAVLQALQPIRGRALAYTYHQEIDGAGVVIGPARMRPTGLARTVPRNRYMGAQAELASVLLPAVVFKTEFQKTPCLFQDLPQVSDCLFLAEWALHCDQVVEVPQYLCQHRVHPLNATSSNIFSLESWVLDEWRLMQTILGWIQEPRPIHWLRDQKLRCLFAARCCVKVAMMKATHPDYARQIRRATRERVGALHRALGGVAVCARDLLAALCGQETKTRKLARAIGL